LAQGLPAVKFTTAVWRKYRASFVAGLDKLLALSSKHYQALLGRVRLSALGVHADRFKCSAELDALIAFWAEHWGDYFIFPKDSKLRTGDFIKKTPDHGLKGAFLSSNEGGRAAFKVSADLRQLPAGRDWEGGDETFRQALYGKHEGSVEGCDGNTRPLRVCLLAHCQMFLRRPDDVLSYARVLNDLLDAVCPAAKTRHQSYTEFRQWLLGDEDAKGNLQTPFGEEVARFVLHHGLFSDPNMSSGTAKRTKDNRTQKMQRQHAIHEDSWLPWLDSLYQALLAESGGVHQAPDSPFLPTVDRPLWGLEAVFLMAVLGMRGIEVVKFSDLGAVDEQQQQERVFSGIALARHISQIGQAKKGWLTYDPPEDEKGEWTLAAVPKPIGLLTADAPGILQIFRHMRKLINTHLEYRAQNSGGQKLRPADRPPSDYTSTADLPQQQPQQPPQPPKQKKQKTAAVSAWAKRVLDRPAGTSPVAALGNAEVMTVLNGAGLEKCFDYLMENYAESSGGKDKPLGNKHALRALYGEVAYALYGEGSLVSRPLFLSRVLAHANEDLNSQLFYQQVFLVRRETPLLDTVTDVNVRKLIQDLMLQASRLADQYRQALGALPRPAPPPPPPAAAPAEHETKHEALKRRALAFFNLHKEASLDRLKDPAFWRGPHQRTFTAGPANRYASLVRDLLEKSTPPEQLSTMFAELI